MNKTRLSSLLKINYPIIQGGMLWLATSELAAAVSNAGALGVISPLAGMEREGDPSKNLRKQINKTKMLTKKPFGINIPLDLPYAGLLMDIVLKEEVRVVITCAGDPCHYSEMLKKESLIVLHVVSNVSQARKAELCKIDGVIAEGIEAAGHDGSDELPLFSLIPQVADAVSIPVIAAGGIVDARGFVAAMSLGAEGVQLGSRFVAVEENIAHMKYKKAILDAGDTDTVITCRGGTPTRSLKTPFSQRLIELEKSGASADDLRAFVGYRSNPTAQIEGTLTKGEAYCGSSAGLIREILPAEEVIRRLAVGYTKIVYGLFKFTKEYLQSDS